MAAQASPGVAVKPGPTVSIDALSRLCSDAFVSAGMSADDAAIGAHVLSMTDGWGVFTHGSKALRGYVRRLYAGGLNPHGRPTIAAEGGAWAVVDGDSSLGHGDVVVCDEDRNREGARQVGSATSVCATVVTSVPLGTTHGWRPTPASSA